MNLNLALMGGKSDFLCAAKTSIESVYSTTRIKIPAACRYRKDRTQSKRQDRYSSIERNQLLSRFHNYRSLLIHDMLGGY